MNPTTHTRRELTSTMIKIRKQLGLSHSSGFMRALIEEYSLTEPQKRSMRNELWKDLKKLNQPI